MYRCQKYIQKSINRVHNKKAACFHAAFCLSVTLLFHMCIFDVKANRGINTPLSEACTSNIASKLGVAVPIPTWA